MRACRLHPPCSVDRGPSRRRGRLRRDPAGQPRCRVQSCCARRNSWPQPRRRRHCPTLTVRHRSRVRRTLDRTRRIVFAFWRTLSSHLCELSMHWSRLRSSRGLFPAPVLTSALRLSAAKISNKLALRASTTGSIFTDNVRAPHEALMPRAVSLGAAFSCLNSAWYGISWGMMGAPLMAPSSRAPRGPVFARPSWPCKKNLATEESVGRRYNPHNPCHAP